MKPEWRHNWLKFSVRVLLMAFVLGAEAREHKTRCGGILKQRESSIRSPNYPNKYPARSDCSWTISAPPGHKIVLDFRDFRLQQNDPCRDWLDIYDGSSIRETKVGRYCGSVKPLPVTSSGHNLHIRFKSDDFIEDRGFRARYNTTLVCGGTYRRYPGTITSPNYPNDYVSQTDCLYKIVVPRGFKVKVKFQDFVLEAANQGGVCYDYVEAFDGSSTRNRSLGIFCGSLQSFTIFSSGEVILLRMISDRSRNNKGFKLLYMAIDIPRNPQSPTTASTPYASINQKTPRVSLATVTSTSCPVDQFRCKNGKCIERRWLCDRQDDCGDSSDEQNCPCRSYQLTCANGACVDKIWSCDGSDDCGDGTDELDCNKPTISSVTINCSVNKGGCHHNCTEFIVRGKKISECVCLPGHRLLGDGKRCVDVDECKLNNGGCHQVCLNIPGSHVCACNQGYSLTPNKITCEDINECSISNGGCNHDCINELGSYHCRCYPGFKFAPDKKKCRDINECEVRNGGCSHWCVNSAGSYYCQCPTGYKLDSDEKTCSDINECAINNGGCEHECQNTLGSYLCTCQDGYIEDFEDFSRCMDIDECAEGMPACFDCKNTPGSYECGCDDPGFVPNNAKTMCVDIDECSKNNGGCGKHTCINTYGSYRCECLPGYKLDFTTYRCEDIDECAINNHAGPCDQICTNTPGSYACSCRDGYKLRQQKKCLDIDECAVNAHQCEHHCNNTVGSYTCSCRKGFFLSIDGFSCSKRKDSRVCGSAPLARPPTEGGWQAAENGAWPWAALIHLENFGDVDGCMGTLIDKEWVLTAAHCVYLGPLVLTPNFVKVELGAFTRASPSHEPVLLDVAEIVPRKEFEPHTKNLTSNIALIRLAKPVKITDDVKPICIPTRQEVTHLLKPGASRRGVLIAWGKTREHKIRKTLHQAPVEIVHRSKCAWSGFKYEVINMICAGFTNVAGTPCISDTGSPLMFAVGRNPSSRKWVLGGITSWGLSIFDNGCHQNYHYTGYTSVERYLKWIKFRGKNSKGNIK